MKRRIILTSALAAMALAVFSLQSEACFFGFSSGFSFGGGGWGYPSYYGWHNPYYRGYGYAPYRHYAYGYTPYRHYTYRWSPYRQYVLTPTVADAPELLAEK